LLDIPIAFLPGGSWNGNACDLHGKIENHACTNVLRGDTIKKEILIVKDCLNKTEMIITCMIFGFFVDAIVTGDKYRRCLKDKRTNLTLLSFIVC